MTHDQYLTEKNNTLQVGVPGLSWKWVVGGLRIRETVVLDGRHVFSAYLLERVRGEWVETPVTPDVYSEQELVTALLDRFESRAGA